MAKADSVIDDRDGVPGAHGGDTVLDLLGSVWTDTRPVTPPSATPRSVLPTAAQPPSAPDLRRRSPVSPPRRLPAPVHP